MFFSFDGVDGAGKSTQIARFAGWLRGRGYEVVECRDPGSTPLGERLRDILLSHHGMPIHRRSEMLLYMAARAQLVEEVIRPALETGKAVISDRFLLANVVYQAYAGGLATDDVWQVGSVAVGGVMPKLTFLLDLSPDAAAKRMNRELDRIEAQGREFQERVRDGFLTEAAKRSDIVVIDASREPDEVHRNVIAAAGFAVPPLGGSSAG
jgi:dTMP kinase